MSGEYYEIGTQIASDHTSAARLVSRTATRRSHKTIPFEGPERQHAVEMIERMAAGDEVALAAFYQRFAPMLYGLALKMMKDEKEAEDVLQEGFVYLWRKAAASSPCVEPSVEQRTRILASIAATPQLARQTAETSLPDGYSFVPNSSDGWVDTEVPGFRTKLLSRGPHSGYQVKLIALAPGGKVPDHDHVGTEEIYMLSGNLHTEGHVMGPGDFLRAEAGTHHRGVVSPDGCLALLILGPAR